MIYELSFRGKAGAVNSGTLQAFDSEHYTTSPFQELINYDQVTFLIHGFNVGDDEGRTSLSTLAKSLTETLEDAIVFVLWPGDSTIGPLSYSFTEGHQANDTAVQLMRRILEHITPSTKLNFVGHSLGCRVVLETIKNLHFEISGKPHFYPIKQVCLMAGAVDDYCLSIPEEYKSAIERVERIVVLSSIEDKVLKYIYPLGDLIQAFIFFWRETFGLALGYHGPKSYTEEWDVFNDIVEPKILQVSANVTTVEIDPVLKVDHVDYLPPDKYGDALNNKQQEATRFVCSVISGDKNVQYVP